MEKSADRGYEYGEMDYCSGKIVEIYSESSGLKYMSYSANDLEKILSNFVLDYKYYLGGEGKYSELYEVIKCGDARIRLVKELNCGKRNELEIEMCRILRVRRLEYLNINLYARYASEMRTDVLNGVEDGYMEKYGVLLNECEKYKKYVESVEKIKSVYKKKNIK